MKSTVKKNWEKANEVPVHEDLSQNLIKNYQPISLFAIFRKIFDRLTFNYLFNYFM